MSSSESANIRSGAPPNSPHACGSNISLLIPYAPTCTPIFAGSQSNPTNRIRAEMVVTMSTEFTKTGPNRARGFTVTFHPAGGVDYTEHASDTIRVDTQLYVHPLRIVSYRESKSLKGMTNARAYEVLSTIQSA